mmetsp:Transcript_28786/g.54709  ORF Transcript_28786/g.54709 Transcript_28786/m.54709 type:complete len:395 (+) Transcript_28786:1337-2521(+)
MPKCAVTETIWIICTNQRQAVGRRRAVAHPLVDALIGDIGQQRRNLSFQQGKGGRTGALLKPTKFDDACGSDSALHRCDYKLACRDHHRGAGHGGGVDQLNMIAALAFQRDLDAQFMGDPLGPWAKGKNDVIGAHRSVRRLKRCDLTVGHRDVGNGGNVQRAALFHKMICERFDIGARVADPPVIFAAYDRLKRIAIDWIEGCISRSADHLIAYAHRIPLAPAIGVRLKIRAGVVAKTIVFFGHETLRRCAGRQCPVLGRRVHQQCAHSVRIMIHMRVGGIAHVAREKGQQTGQVRPAQKQGRVAVKQHAGRFAHQSRDCHRDNGPCGQNTRIAVARTRRRPRAVDHGDGIARPLQPNCTRDADNAGPRHQNMFVCHRRSQRHFRRSRKACYNP